MEPFVTHRGRVALLDWSNVNTDLIIPARYLKKVERTGFGPLLFADKRYEPGGAPTAEQPDEHGQEVADFPLNDRKLEGATVLVVGHNFGCGSSREQAVWALADFGIRCVIAPSFGEIFYGNCFRNGMLPITLPDAEHGDVMLAATSGVPLTVDLNAQEIRLSEERAIAFQIDPHRRQALLLGLDQIGEILAGDAADIKAFESRQKTAAPWLYLDPQKLSYFDDLGSKDQK